MDVQDWFDSRTFHCRQFRNVAKLVEAKQRQGLSISLGLPTLNVEETVGKIVSMLVRVLVERHPLLDQVAIIDSHSSDRTVEIAESLGAEVYFDDDLLPTMGTAAGKGEALWKSLDALWGDIVIWIDSDIRNIHPRFVYGLVGPLLTDSEVKFVKAFYERPLHEGSVVHETGGGRVTELMARPALNLFYPHLSGFMQPLSGEYAGRREVFESVPFFTGYAVETGLLVDISERYGLESMAQVDLAQRIHSNQPLQALGRMSFAILKAVMMMLEREGRVKGAPETGEVFNAVAALGEGYTLAPNEVPIIQRPRIDSVQEYLEHRKQKRKRGGKRAPAGKR
ncbi:MAG: glucosyl-3-phosphoglycerate synthase [Actinobacteria bacterium]|nr:MAG: glucosyl-3-phosphoglycerate synthase [Actinomycetota bacterium]